MGEEGRDVITGPDDLVFQADLEESLGIGDFRGYQEGLISSRLLGAVVDLATLERIPWSRSSDSLQRDSGSSLLLTSTAGVNDFSSARSDWADVFFWAG